MWRGLVMIRGSVFCMRWWLVVFRGSVPSRRGLMVLRGSTITRRRALLRELWRGAMFRLCPALVVLPWRGRSPHIRWTSRRMMLFTRPHGRATPTLPPRGWTRSGWSLIPPILSLTTSSRISGHHSRITALSRWVHV